MLACIQRRQNFSSQREFCPPKVLDAPPVQLSLSVPLRQPCVPKGDTAAMASRYPSPAELDAFAQKTGHSPLSIKIFPSNVRVPQHKQLSRTVNGLDTTGQRYSPYPQACPAGSQGLLAVAGSCAPLKGGVKAPDGRRTKHARGPGAGAPYNMNNGSSNHANHGEHPLSSCTAATHGRRTYHPGPCKRPDMPSEALSSGPMAAGQSLAPRHGLHGPPLPPGGQASQRGGEEAHASPSRPQGAPHPRSSSSCCLAFSGAVPPSQGGYGVWQPHPPHALRGYTASPDSSVRPPPPYDLPASLNFPMGHYFAPPWDSVRAAPDADCYTSRELGTASCMARPARDMGLAHHQPQLHPQPHIYVPAPSQAHSTDPLLCCGLPSSSLCHASALSSSLQSLECLISEIQPPCIKERMLGRGYQALGLPQLLEGHQKAHIQLPVYR